MVRRSLDVAVEAARAAGDVVRAYFEKKTTIEVRRKPWGEIVTNVDEESERVIREHLSKEFPTHDILGEEGGLTDHASAYRWHVDPIDGTTNFVRGNPNFSISIALATGDDLVVGVILAPMLKAMYTATAGGGAYANGIRLHVNNDGDLAIARVLWCEGNAKNAERAERLRHIVEQRAGICDRIGSSALECAAVASGTAAAYFTTVIRSWDVAAGKLIIEEAGGKVTNFHGEPFRLTPGDFIASNGKVHDTLVSLLS